MHELVVYSRRGCHLCEEAHEQLQLLEQQGMNLSIEMVEIADSEALMDRYGITIPVIRVDEREIGWPFTIDELRTFLEISN